MYYSRRSAKPALGLALTLGYSLYAVEWAYPYNAARQPPSVTRSSVTQTPAPAVASLDPESLDFGDQVVGESSPPQRITVTKTGGKPLYIDSVSITGDDRKDFALSKDACTGATVAPNRSCVIDVRFTPTDIDERTATLVLKDKTPGSPQDVALNGNGINAVDVPPTGRP